MHKPWSDAFAMSRLFFLQNNAESTSSRIIVKTLFSGGEGGDDDGWLRGGRDRHYTDPHVAAAVGRAVRKHSNNLVRKTTRFLFPFFLLDWVNYRPAEFSLPLKAARKR